MNLTSKTDPRVRDLRATARDMTTAEIERLIPDCHTDGAAFLRETLAERGMPTVGMGATIHCYSDNKACTVIAVSKSGKRITLQRDKATLLNGADSGEKDALQFSPGGFVGHTSGQQRYAYESDPNGSTWEFSLRTYRGKTRWVLAGDSAKSGQSCTLGKRHEHYDFNF